MTKKAQARYAIVADDESGAGWRSAISRADQNGKRLRSTMTAAFAGFVGIQTFTSAIANAIEFGDEIGKLATKIGSTAKETSELVAIAKQFDIEASSLATSLRKMQVSISQAASGNKTLKDTFAALGLDVAAIKRLAPERQFEEIAEAISRLSDPTDRARAATELFGRAGADLLPLFERGAEGIRIARREAQQFGTVISDLDVKKLQEADDAFKRLKASVDGLSVTSASFFGPFLSGTADAIRRLLGGATELEKLENKLRILRENDSTIPVFFNFGYLDGGGVVLGPEEIKKAIGDIEARVIRLREAGSSAGSGPGQRFRGGVVRRDGPPGFSAPAGEGKVPDGFTPEMRESIKAAEEWRAFIDETDQGVQESFNKTLEDIEESFKNLPEPIIEATDTLSVFAEEGARNLQDHFANFLFDPFDGGLKGMLKGFSDTIRRMLAEAASAKLFETLFGTTGSGGGSGLGGFLGSIFGGGGGSGGGGVTSGIVEGEHDWLSKVLGVFGGGKAGGGPLSPGKWYVAGEHGPEPIWGGGPGAFAAGYGRGGGGGGVVFAPVYNVDARGATQDAIRALPEVLRQNNEIVKRDIIEGLRRGRYTVTSG